MSSAPASPSGPQDREHASSPRDPGFGAVAEVWAQRRGARTRGDVAYLVYLVLLTIGVLGVPAGRLVAQGLARPDVLVLLLDPTAPAVLVGAVGLLAAAAVGIGGVRGPAVVSPFFAATLASGPMPRRRALLRPFLRALLVPVGGLVVTAALLAATLWSAGAAAPAEAAWMVIAAFGAGLLVHSAWLAGEILEPAGRRVGVLGLLLATAGLVALPTEWGPASVHPAATGAASVWALLLVLLGGLAVIAGVPALDRVRGTVLRSQAERWEAARTMAGSGDLTGAGGAFRALPSTGRRLPAVGGRPLALLYLRRDAVAWMRTPERSLLGALGAVVGGALLVLPSILTGPPGWCGACVGALLLWGSAGAVTDGIRHAVATLGAPPLFAQGVRSQILLHATAPFLLLCAGAALGGSGALVLGSAGAIGRGTLLLIAPMAASLVLARAWAAAKGPMPLKLATPMPTAQGDVSVMPQLIWHSDWVWTALLLVLVPLALLHLSGLPAGAIASGILLAIAALMTRARLRELRR